MSIWAARVCQSIRVKDSQALRIFAVIALLAAVFGGAQWVGSPALRLQASAAGSEPWRLITAHCVHLTIEHAALNLAVFALFVMILAELRRPFVLLSSGLVAAFCVDIGVLLFHPSVGWYVGFSGVLYGLLCAGALADLRRQPALGVVVLVGVLIKLAADSRFGPSPLTETIVGGPILSAAHVYGAMGGLLVGIGLVCKKRGTDDGRPKEVAVIGSKAG